ncbi:hypothetical protein L2E82_21790 [Cichorium intybus]|uniref:Uncharacterized protein n=1 Tax=Cichorium intybus TaxID=13427 RepID=A0ACB9DW24_CICIN|nr:hypothetical protein L2E82_21790 [Cichorium intybus]
MVQATIILEDMMKTEYLRKEWRYWSSTSTAARIYNVSALALQNYILDASVRDVEIDSLPDLEEQLYSSEDPEQVSR